MFKINCLNPIAAVGLGKLDAQYEITDQFEAADAVLVRSAAMHDLDLSDNLKAIARAGAGVNNIPLDKCAAEGIVVFNTPGANANGVKEAVITGLLLASRDFVGGVNWVKENKDDANIAKTTEKQKKNYAGTEIAGKKIGVIGLGAIGVLVANICDKLGMEVYGYDPFISVKAAWNLSRNIKPITNVEDIYKTCDFITIHVPLMDSTKKMVNADAIAMMKDGAVILNFARNGLVDEDALVEALESGKLRHYVTDFPTPKVAGAKGVIAFPHLGASTEESEDNCAVMAVEQLMDYLENGNIKNSVNFPNTDMGVCQTEGRIAILHRNIPNMLTQFTSIFSKDNINITEMSNKTKGKYSYAIFDVESVVDEEAINEIAAIDGVLKVRLIK